MRLFIALACLLTACLAQRPQPCTSPPLMSGALSFLTQNEELTIYIQYVYDAMGQRIRLWEQGSYENTTFTGDYLLHFREGVLYDINDAKRTCQKMPLKSDFQPMAIPTTASLVGQAVLGSSSVPGGGLPINTWTGEWPNVGGRFISSVTQLECLPVSTLYHTDRYGWVVMGFFNNVVGIPDLGLLNTPNFCPPPEMEPEGESHDFLSLFHKKI